jgi:hypothetical protein
MNTVDPVPAVLAWHDAANTQNVQRLQALSSPDVEIVGPRGSGRGRELLRDWLGRAGATFAPKRVFARGNAVVVEQHAAWRAPDSSTVVNEVDLASSFVVDGGLVSRFQRFDSLDEALAASGLGMEDLADTSSAE